MNKNIGYKKILSIILIFILIFSMALASAQETASEDISDSQSEEVSEEALEEVSDIDVTSIRNYSDYLDVFGDREKLQNTIIIKATESYKANDTSPIIKDGFDGVLGEVLETDDAGSIEWSFNVPDSGLYNIYVKYYSRGGTTASIERGIAINGSIPFIELRSYKFSKVFENETEIRQDARGNDLRPMQKEKSRWQIQPVSDITGYYMQPFEFYFEEGENTITFIAEKEPMIISEIVLYREPELKKYQDILEYYKSENYNEIKGFERKIQGEDAVYKSDSTLYPIFDRSSPLTEPYSPRNIKLNTIGGINWRMPGQWIEWELDIPESGLYNLGIKYRQNIIRGINSHRKISVNNEVLYEEMFNVPFSFSSGWQANTLSDSDGNAYLIYFEEGINTIRIEAVLGGLSSVVDTIEESILELNALYRKILMITGPNPDIYRDYRLVERISSLEEILSRNSQKMFDVRDELFKYTGERGSNAAIIETLAVQLESLADDPENIPSRLDRFKTNVGGLSTWILSIKEQPLEIDYIVVKSPGVQMPKAAPNFIERINHELKLFYYSFVEDYSLVGEIQDNIRNIEVWVSLGRDQADIIKSLIDNSFTPESDIVVNLRLVDGAVLLPAVVAGRGPDVSLFQPQTLPINYAMRNALIDLTEFDDIKEIESRFSESALTPYRFEGGLYGIPEQEMFDMLFYRKDILDELGLKVPETWDEVYDLIPDLQKYNLDFAVPSVAQDIAAGAQTAPNTLFTMILYQLGGNYYKDDFSRSILDDDIGIAAFDMWTELFNSYRLPQRVNFVNRFRVGEVPIGIANYTIFNHLSVFAPEIRGLWGFAPVPGFRQEDGTIVRNVASSSSASIMIRDNVDKNMSWEFIKWWTDAPTQIGFGQGMESVLGISARWPTANLEAFEQIPWTTSEMNQIRTQWEWARGIPEVPGGYFLSRHLDNALRRVVIQGDDPRETMLDYVEIINEEIRLKRIEFGLE